jgi:hypothetical protein
MKQEVKQVTTAETSTRPPVFQHVEDGKKYRTVSGTCFTDATRFRRMEGSRKIQGCVETCNKDRRLC